MLKINTENSNEKLEIPLEILQSKHSFVSAIS